MMDPDRDALIRDLARGVIARAAPQELPVFRVQADAYFRAPDAAVRRIASGSSEKGRDEALGFGAAEAAALLTPVALAVATSVITLLFEIVQESVKDEATDALGAKIRSFFGKAGGAAASGGEKDAPSLSAEQLALVRQTAREKALQLALSETQAALLADAVAGSLASRKG